MMKPCEAHARLSKSVGKYATGLRRPLGALTDRKQTTIGPMKKTALFAAIILGVTMVSSLAQQAPPQGQGGDQGGRGGWRGRGGGGNVMNALDMNSDGTLDTREIQNAALSLRKLDTNKDGKLTPDELGTRGGRGDMSQRMLEMDKNKDGKLTSDEVPERMQRFIERMDRNGDGAVDKAEMEAFQQEMQRRFEEGGGRRGGPGGPDGRGGPPED